MAQLERYLAHLDPDHEGGNFTLVRNTLLSLNKQQVMRVVYFPDFQVALLWICYGPGKNTLQCAAVKKAEVEALLADVEALPLEEFEFPTFDDATFGLPALPATFDDLAHEFNLHPASGPPVEFASSDYPSFDEL